jgi:hypothetical protein
MPNFIKSATTVSTGTIKKNNFLIGVNTNLEYGPTPSTGFWSGITPPSGGYTVYEQKMSQGPSIRIVTNDTELITIAKQYGGTNINTVGNALNYLTSQPQYMVTNIDYPNIVTRKLAAILDAGFIPSYPESGTTVYDLSGKGADGTINGKITWISSGTTGAQSYFSFTGDPTSYISSTVLQNYLDCTMVLMPDFSYSTVTGLVGLIATSSPATNSDKSLRITGANGTGPWSMTGRNPGDANDWAYPTATTFYVNGVSGNTLNNGWNIFGGYRTNPDFAPGAGTFPYFIGSGGFAADNRAFQGKIAVVLLYEDRLTEAEQQQNYNALRGRFGI